MGDSGPGAELASNSVGIVASIVSSGRIDWLITAGLLIVAKKSKKDTAPIVAELVSSPTGE